jgi:hypothetical protein
MFDYYCQLRFRYHAPIVPIAVFTDDHRWQPDKRVPDVYTEEFEGRQYLRFDYHLIKLKDLDARTFLREESPLAVALAAKMHYDKQQRVRLKADFLRLIVGAPLDDARRHMLVEFIETYMMLPKAEQQAFEKLVAVEPEYEGVTTVMTIYEKRGVEKGRQEGEVAGLRQAVLVAAQSSFGEVPQALSHSVRETDDGKALTALLETICRASSVDDVLSAL